MEGQEWASAKGMERGREGKVTMESEGKEHHRIAPLQQKDMVCLESETEERLDERERETDTDIYIYRKIEGKRDREIVREAKSERNSSR